MRVRRSQSIIDPLKRRLVKTVQGRTHTARAPDAEHQAIGAGNPDDFYTNATVISDFEDTISLRRVEARGR
ncbi:MAG TPA: hypothetical protein VKX46_06325, partial [Ktedonobacteraceae bacterium]|nr:hypothetical protein [Ktedonobacteraceae bacterium]